MMAVTATTVTAAAMTSTATSPAATSNGTAVHTSATRSACNSTGTDAPRRPSMHAGWMSTAVSANMTASPMVPAMPTYATTPT